MIAGHLGVALGARALGPKAPLAWMLAAVAMALAYAGTHRGAIALVFGLVVLGHVPPAAFAPRGP